MSSTVSHTRASVRSLSIKRARENVCGIRSCVDYSAADIKIHLVGNAVGWNQGQIFFVSGAQSCKQKQGESKILSNGLNFISSRSPYRFKIVFVPGVIVRAFLEGHQLKFVMSSVKSPCYVAAPWLVPWFLPSGNNADSRGLGTTLCQHRSVHHWRRRLSGFQQNQLGRSTSTST